MKLLSITLLFLSSINGLNAKTNFLETTLQHNLDNMISNVQQSKNIIGFDVAGHKNAETTGTCNELLSAIQKNHVSLPKAIASTADENYEKYFERVSSIVQKYSDFERERLKIKGDSVEKFDDEISPLLEKDFYKPFSLLSLSTEKNRVNDEPYKITRILYQSSIDSKNDLRYLEAIFGRYPSENNINTMSINALSMDGRSGHSLTAYDFLSIRNEIHFSSFGFFSLKGKIYIWIMEKKPHLMIQENWLHNSNYVFGPNLSGTNEIIDYLENTKWDHDLFIASPIGSDDESHCQFYLKMEK